MIWGRLAEVIQCIHIIYTSEYVFIISIYSRFLFKLSFTIDCQHMNVSCSLEVNIKPQYLGSVKKKAWLWISIVLRVRLALSRGVHFLNRKVVTRHNQTKLPIQNLPNHPYLANCHLQLPSDESITFRLFTFSQVQDLAVLAGK